jgi:membrane protease YdiL (CAAX protease family)
MDMKCSYCGAKLFPFFYFCVACGKPYKSHESVVSPDLPEEFTDGQKVNRLAPAVGPMFWAFFSAVILGGILTFAILPDEPLLGIAISTAILAALTIGYSIVHWPMLKVSFQRSGFESVWAWVGLLALGPILGINVLYHGFLQKLVDQDAVSAPDYLAGGELSIWIPVFFVCVCPAIVEETAFRGLIQGWLMRAITPLKAIGFAAFLFTVLHFSILSFPYLFGLGCLLGWVNWKTQSLYPAILIHFLHNLVVITYF